MGKSSWVHMANVEKVMEVLALTVETRALAIDPVAPSTASDAIEPPKLFIGFLIRRVPFSTLLSMTQGSFRRFLIFMRQLSFVLRHFNLLVDFYKSGIIL